MGKAKGKAKKKGKKPAKAKKDKAPVVASLASMPIRASFDAAQTTDSNRRHWANADALSADAAASPEKRRIIRNRARYEVYNNGYARGLVNTIGNDVIGKGPRLQMQTKDAKLNDFIENEFASWARAARLAQKLKTMRIAKGQDGEGLGVLFTNLPLRHRIKLDLKLIESEQLADPYAAVAIDGSVDGIVLDGDGNPVEYHVLKEHPGSNTLGVGVDFDRIPEGYFIHWFDVTRPGMHRGLPDILPALPLYAQLRRFTLAVIDAGEAAARFTACMKTDAPSGGDAADVDPMATMELESNMLTFVPEGWEPFQMKAEQPNSTYKEFKREILSEIGRCLSMPYNVVACDSSDYNYASGRLDHQTYFKAISVEQSDAEAIACDKVFDRWIEEAVLEYDEIPRLDSWPHQWIWPGHEHVDPTKEATGQEKRLANHTTTLAEEYARQGKDWEVEIRQRGKELELIRELDLPMKGTSPGAATVDAIGDELVMRLADEDVA